MKAIAIQNNNKLENFVFEILSQNELNEIRGGGKPKTRDKDVFDFEEE